MSYEWLFSPVLPDGWAQCDGQVIADTDSVYNGVTLPDLNGEARFLRGGAVSGTNQTHQLQNHTHGVPVKLNKSPSDGSDA